jgi:hypothetical protein
MVKPARKLPERKQGTEKQETEYRMQKSGVRRKRKSVGSGSAAASFSILATGF